MKLATVLSTITLAGSMASADYQCLTDDGTQTLNVHQHHSSQSKSVLVIHSGLDFKTPYKGHQISENGELFKEIQLALGNSLGFLVITHSPNFEPTFCGRGACDPTVPEGESIYAKLTIGGETTVFACHETNF